MSSPLLLSQRSHQSRDLPISFLMQQAVENQDCLSLAAGLVDPDTLPVSVTQEVVSRVLRSKETGKRALQYGTTPGSEALRQELLNHFCSLEGINPDQAPITADQIVCTTGSQQLLSITSEILLDPGDICMVAGPTYFVFAGNLVGVGAKPLTVRTDEQGMDPVALDLALADLAAEGQLHRVKVIYVVSYYDNPTGLCVSLERRKAIVDVARKWSRDHRIMVLEDAAYRELRYDGPELPSLWSYDDSQSHVIYTQTFSKTFSPGIRVGFGVVPEELVAPICERKGNEDFGSSNFNQAIIREVLSDGLYAKHLEEVKASYRRKRDSMLAAAEQYFSDLESVSWVHPHGGLYVWMSLPEQIATDFGSPLFEAALENGVMYVPGSFAYAGLESPPNHQMRLSYGVLDPDGITEGMRRLAEAVRTVLG